MARKVAMKLLTRPKRSGHPLGRPPKSATNVLALLSCGAWVPDDERPHIAFSYEDARGSAYDIAFPMAIAAECDCGFEQTCPMMIATDETCARFGASNGQSFPKRKKSKK